MARVAQHDHGLELRTAHQIVGHHLLPAVFCTFRHGCVAVAGQIGQHAVVYAVFTHAEQVDVLGAAWGFGGVGQLFLLGNGVDAGGFARV